LWGGLLLWIYFDENYRTNKQQLSFISASKRHSIPTLHYQSKNCHITGHYKVRYATLSADANPDEKGASCVKNHKIKEPVVCIFFGKSYFGFYVLFIL
jgi:hypothetical protein